MYASFKADIGITAGWRRLVGDPVMSATLLGFIGAHGADLPKYRGFASTHYALLLGDPFLAFSLMHLKPGTADDGDIISKHIMELNR